MSITICMALLIVVMLFLGGFVLASAASKVGLDIRLAKVLLMPFGTNPKFVLLGLLFIIGVFSMFMSNTATAAMMIAILMPIFKELPQDDKGRIALALSIPIVPSLVIGACAFAAGELVFRTDVVQSLKESNNSLYQTLENAKKQNKHILDMIPMIDI